MAAVNDHSRVFNREDATGLRGAINRAVFETPIHDMHTHLYAPPFGTLLLYGIDELLTYHYLIAEFFRVSPMSYEQFWALDKQGQADAIWQALFIEHSPLSEACRGVLTTLDKLGLETSSRDLNAYRGWFAEQTPEAHVAKVFEVANIEKVVMTNDPFDDLERPVWEGGFGGDPRFEAALRIDPLINDWANTAPRLAAWGYEVDASLSACVLAEVRQFLHDWIKRMNAVYMAVSLPGDFNYPEDSARATLIRECILPVAREYNIPFAMMIGVKRQVNPLLRLAGDTVENASVAPVERLCEAFPENKFMVTMLARENQHALAVTARKFRNLMIFGCWWFLNNPSLIEEITTMRIELLGPSVVPQHSDARVLDQVVYKWEHSREIIARVLRHKYADLVATGWQLSEAEIRRDAARFLGGNFRDFVAKSL